MIQVTSRWRKAYHHILNVLLDSASYAHLASRKRESHFHCNLVHEVAKSRNIVQARA